jgi:NSS family neurotransmitter:Na+ symporter
MLKVIAPLFIGIGLIQNTIAELSTLYGGYPLSQLISFGWLTAALLILFALYIAKTSSTTV